MARLRRVTLLLVAALAIRLWGLDRHGLWFDETLSVSEAVGSVLSRPIPPAAEPFSQREFWQGNSVAAVLPAVGEQDGGNTILYAIALHFWVRAFGTGDGAVRSLSVLCGVLIVLAGARLAAITAGVPAARWAAVMLALHPLLVHYSQEARAYGLATLLALLATLAYVRLLGLDGGAPGRSWLAYGFCAAGAVLSHYLAAGVLLAHGAFAALKVRSAPVAVRLAASAGLAGLLVGGWLWIGGAAGYARIQAKNAEYARRAQAAADPAFAHRATAGEMAAGALQMAYVLCGNSLQSAGLRLREMLPLLLPPAVLLWMAWAQAQRRPDRPALVLLLVLSASTVVVALGLGLASGHTVAFQTLYATFASPYCAILLGVGASEAWKGRAAARGLLAAQLAIMALSLKMVYDDAPRFRPRNPFAAAAHDIAARYRSGDRVVYGAWADARRVNLYLPRQPEVLQRVVPGPPGVIGLDRDGVVRPMWVMVSP